MSRAIRDKVNHTDIPVAGLVDSLAIKNEIADMNNICGAKNLLPNNATSQTINGVTFTVNSDGSMTLNGTCTANGSFTVSNVMIPKGEYILTGKVSDDAVMFIQNTSGSVIARAIEGQEEFTLSADTNIQASFWIVKDEVYSNSIVYPMIRPASIEDDTYAPYAMTNRELTDIVSPIDMSSYFTFGTGFALETSQVPVEFWKIGRIAILSIYFKCTVAGRIIGTISNSNILPSNLFVAPCASNDGDKECSVIIHNNGSVYSDVNIDVGNRYALNAVWIART